MLQFLDAEKSYGSERILVVPSLKLETGIYWVKGVNGSGKTTFLKMAAAMIPFQGDISCKGISVKKDPIHYRQNVSWAEAEPLYPPFITGLDLISLYVEIRKSNMLEAISLIKLFNMQDYIANKTGTYSTGMSKKLSLVLALTGDLSWIILDEPLITLDPASLDTLYSGKSTQIDPLIPA